MLSVSQYDFKDLYRYLITSERDTPSTIFIFISADNISADMEQANLALAVAIKTGAMGLATDIGVNEQHYSFVSATELCSCQMYIIGAEVVAEEIALERQKVNVKCALGEERDISLVSWNASQYATVLCPADDFLSLAG